MSQHITILEPHKFPPLLQEIPDPPKNLFIRGKYPNTQNNMFLSVVGARKYSPYGKEVIKMLFRDLRGYPIVIVSGLALGIDAIAHTEALKADLTTIAIPGSGLDDSVLYPRTNINLARSILESGGALVSPFENTFKATPWSFPERNRIMAGLTHATLVIEATMRSGTLITARLAMEYNRDVFAVPGPITNPTSTGPHHLIRNGATPITTSADILEALGITEKKSIQKQIVNLGVTEKRIVNALSIPLTRDELIQETALAVKDINIALSSLEIKGVVEEQLGKITLR